MGSGSEANAVASSIKRHVTRSVVERRVPPGLVNEPDDAETDATLLSDIARLHSNDEQLGALPIRSMDF